MKAFNVSENHDSRLDRNKTRPKPYPYAFFNKKIKKL
jgi:hypothetical protein